MTISRSSSEKISGYIDGPLKVGRCDVCGRTHIHGVMVSVSDEVSAKARVCISCVGKVLNAANPILFDKLSGKRIKQARQTAKKSLEEVGSYIGVSRQCVWYWENGGQPTMKHRVKLLAALNCGVEDIREEE